MHHDTARHQSGQVWLAALGACTASVWTQVNHSKSQGRYVQKLDKCADWSVSYVYHLMIVQTVFEEAEGYTQDTCVGVGRF